MKRFLITLAIFMVAVCVFATDSIKIEVKDAPTNSTAVTAEIVTSGGPLYGMLEGIVIDFSGYATPTVDVDIVTYSGIGTLVERTIFSADALTVASEGYYPIRVPAVGTDGVAFGTNEYVRIPLVGDKVKVSVYDANTNDIIDTAVILIFDK